ncbi:hypothetical protein [Chitinophaga niabensis]|uniref:Uncharacterized protein n=1 Tax=Chitinophaga niabensis TaxID=536979 RepID=A0A1N6K0F5_9BACT|nr:hypothetical protein [Chitinophaga niabensis]SIO50058.1 hypothetical protein SAMN04488055_4829 [Chitinophaga niabensis]
MKTRGLMLIALLISGAAFAQNTTVKTEQTTSVTVKARSGNEEATAKGNATVKSDAAVHNDAETISQSTIALEKDISGTTFDMKDAADQKMNAVVETGKQSTASMAQGIKNTLNSSAGISGGLMKTTSLKIAPVKINSQIISRTGLFIR